MKRLSFFIGLTLAFTFFLGITAYAQVSPDSTGLKATAGAAGLVRSESVSELIGNVIGTLLSMVGVLFFLLMLYGGVLWMTARGNEDQTTKSMHTIIAASIGIVIVLASYALTNFVFKSVNEQQGAAGGGAAGAGGNAGVQACPPFPDARDVPGDFHFPCLGKNVGSVCTLQVPGDGEQFVGECELVRAGHCDCK